MLTQIELKTIKEKLKRDPTQAELAVFDALWSEHCSYKSSKRWFNLFNTESPRVYLGIGEGAGLIDIGDDYVIGLGLESHNHPSAVDPFNGAATGVGGIIRDILSQGCRPIAILDCLRFGEPVTNRQKLLLDQVVLGISSYGNCVGIPTLGGDVEFAKEFETNPLVNAMCVGIAKKDEIIRSIASDTDDLVVVYGSSTGRDGIGGVSFASEELDDDQRESRGSVQIGDPLTEKLLIDVTLELRDADLLNGLQDLGGGGLVCAATEMAEKGKKGIFLDLSKINVREENMQGWELLISESQERMLGLVSEDRIDDFKQIMENYEMNYAILGRVKDGNDIIAAYNETIETHLPVDFTITGFPIPKRETGELPRYELPSKTEAKAHPLIEMLGNFNIASRKPIYQQYDQSVQGNTVYGPGRDAGVLYLPNGKYLAVSAGTNSYMTSRNPRTGASLSTLAVIRDVVARGATPIAMVDSLNAGNPEKSSSYAEFVEITKGVADVSQALNIPIVGGNVSFYNESEIGGKSLKIYPSAFVGIAGLIEEGEPISPYLSDIQSKIYLVGPETGFLKGSQYEKMYGVSNDEMTVNFDVELESANFITSISKIISSATDIGRGGLLVSLAKWAIDSDKGIDFVYETQDLTFLYGEQGARYLIQISNENEPEFFKLCAQYDADPTLVARVTSEKVFNYDKDNIWSIPYLKDLWEKPIAEALKI